MRFALRRLPRIWLRSLDMRCRQGVAGAPAWFLSGGALDHLTLQLHTSRRRYLPVGPYSPPLKKRLQGFPGGRGQEID